MCPLLRRQHNNNNSSRKFNNTKTGHFRGMEGHRDRGTLLRLMKGREEDDDDLVEMSLQRLVIVVGNIPPLYLLVC